MHTTSSVVVFSCRTGPLKLHLASIPPPPPQTNGPAPPVSSTQHGCFHSLCRPQWPDLGGRGQYELRRRPSLRTKPLIDYTQDTRLTVQNTGHREAGLRSRVWVQDDKVGTG
ncbi:hypothetical protein BaRGS_00018313 [Batillaria attramentaria]|uniref:Uncharacterized protein n=1 Tax=Batillaria attramentaria TaxID=370345 RepID=A0ABD0KUR4_9CAEN